ncbi:hypothetical protein ACIQRS_29735 [Streptomyces termitum]|uniref:Uncharacterized protein n=1 Tax=Streptomyces termitum TaxID=67368 RepID=A0A918TAG4_9ACTN|nr:hypothetical protein [Streptomyces termitum]GHB08132.1 hypothetical protein GCM10010305_58980 [Streptomyces termitum]
MKITEREIMESWRRTADGHPLLRESGPPAFAPSEEEWDEWADLAEGEGDDRLFLFLPGDGTVRGRYAAVQEQFVARELAQVLYLLAEHAIRRRGGGPEEVADALGRIDPAWGRRFRDGGLDDPGTVAACGRDPLEGFAWVAESWHEQAPYTTLAFYRAAPGRTVDPERLALLYGADPAQVAAGTRLKDLLAKDGGRSHWDRQWESCAYGREGEWTFLLHHDSPPGAFADKEAYAALGIEESVWLSATSAKAIYTLDYLRGGRLVSDDPESVLELIWYERGRAPHIRGGVLDFHNRALRRAELDHPGLTDTFALYFHALEESLGLRLPRRDFEEGLVRTAYWAGRTRPDPKETL